jgi:glycosyltransferase involved in cell wall biosynthesis
MTVRVVYDSTMLASGYGKSERKIGLYTATEELARELNKVGDVELILACLDCSSRYLYSILRTSKYVEDEATNECFRTIDTIGSRSGLKIIYDRFCNFDLAAWRFYDRQAPNLSLFSILNKLRFKLVREAFGLFASVDFYLSFASENFDIFHSTCYKLPAKALTKDLPRVLTVYDLIPLIAPDLVAPALRESFKATIASIDIHNDWVICISEYTQMQFCEYTGMAPERTFVTPLAAASHFHPVNEPDKIATVRSRYHIPDGDYFLTLASYLAPHKNLDRLMRCFFRLIAEHPELEINLVLAGSNRLNFGDNLPTGSPQFRSRVIYTGYVADEDLSALYSGATAFIFPSLFEGFGLPPLEAMQCGTPVIASNTTSLPEVVGNAGIAIDPLDEDAICQAMLAVATNRDLAQTLSRKGLERAKDFSWAKCASDTADVYRKILSHRNS